jgi:hypothetical protein
MGHHGLLQGYLYLTLANRPGKFKFIFQYTNFPNVPLTVFALISFQRFRGYLQPLGTGIAQSAQRLSYGLDDRGTGVRFPVEAGNSLFSTTFRRLLGPPNPLCNQYRGIFPRGWGGRVLDLASHLQLSGVRLSTLGTAVTYWPTVPAPDDRWWWLWNNWWMKIGRGNRSTRRKSAPVSLCLQQIPHDLNRARTRAAAVGSQRLTAWAMAQPRLNNLGTGINLPVQCPEITRDHSSFSDVN